MLSRTIKLYINLILNVGSCCFIPLKIIEKCINNEKLNEIFTFSQTHLEITVFLQILTLEFS